MSALTTSTSTATASLSTSTSSGVASANTNTATLSTSSSTQFANANAQNAAFSNMLSRSFACAVAGQLFDGTSCRTPAVTIPDFSSGITCNSGLRGALRLNGSSVVVCDGAAWRVSYTAPLGTSINPAASCAAIVSAGDFKNGNGQYILRLSDGSAQPIACEGSTSRGGDGTSALKVASTCATALAYFGVRSGRVFIDSANSPPNPAAAVLVYCQEGVNQGGDGSSSAQSALSCSILINVWGKASGLYWVGGKQVYVCLLFSWWLFSFA